MSSAVSMSGLSSAVPVIFWPLLAWGLVWKAIALWKAARRGQLGWYIALVVINTVGILEIIYIFAVAPRHPEIGEPQGL
jgi:methionyl-tRNA synthetase